MKDLLGQMSAELARTICDKFGTTYPAVGFLGAQHWDDVTAIIRPYMERAFNEGHEQGVDDEAMIRIRQEAQPSKEGHPARVCPQCGNVFEQRTHNQKFCSYKCRHQAKTRS